MADTQVLDRKRATAILNTKDEKRSISNTANILCCDISGSMIDPIGRGDSRPKITGMKEAATAFISNLPVSSYLSVIVFSDTAKILYDLQPLGSNKLSIISEIQKINAGGSTAMNDALFLVEKQFKKALSSHTMRLFLESDGMPDEDPTSIAERLKSQGVQVTTIGFGDEIDEALLKNMASVSASGKTLYEFCHDANHLTAFLKKQTQSLTI